MPDFLHVQVAEESEIAAASNAGAEATEKAISGDPLSNVHLPSTAVPSTSTVDNSSTIASLRMVSKCICYLWSQSF